MHKFDCVLKLGMGGVLLLKYAELDYVLSLGMGGVFIIKICRTLTAFLALGIAPDTFPVYKILKYYMYMSAISLA